MEMTSRTLRFGVVGCGSMASQVHCPNMNQIPYAKTVAYCDIDEAKAGRFLELHGGDYCTTDAQRIFSDETLDGVLIQVGPALHPPLVQAAAKAGKHIFVEKPIAVDLADALETVKVVEAASVQFMFGTCNRLAPTVKMAKRMCPHPHYSYCQCSGTVTHQACHNIDLAVNLFHEAPLERVYAGGGQFWNLDPHLPVDSFSAVLSFADGSTHTYIQHGNSYNAVLKKYHFQLFGDDHCVFLAERFKKCLFMRSPDSIERSWAFEGADTDRGPFGYMGHYDELKELVDKIRQGGKCTMTVRDAALVLAVEKAILHSIEQKTVVDFSAFLAEQNADFLLA